MKTVFGEELRKHILVTIERIKENMEDRDDRITAGRTDIDDCFMSSRVEENALHEANLQLEILDGDGTMEIETLLDQNGEEVAWRWVETKFGWRTVTNGVFANSMYALAKKTGLTIGKIKVPCWTKFYPGSGGGLCSVYSGRYDLVRWHTNMVTGEYVGYPGDKIEQQQSS